MKKILIAVLVLVFIIAGCSESKPVQVEDDYVEFNNHLFLKNKAGLWNFSVTNVNNNQPYDIALRNLPYDVDWIPVNGDLSDFYMFKEHIDLIFQPNIDKEKFMNITLAMVEMTTSLTTIFQIPIAIGCNEQGSDCPFVVESCENAKNPVIEFIDAEDARIIKKNANCIQIYGDSETIIPATEKVLYLWYKILKV